jgi:hypothetical protein
MLHWDGTNWRSVSLPSQLLYPTVIIGEQASSANNFSVFTNNNTADVFNGSVWTSKQLPTWVERPIEGGDPALASAGSGPPSPVPTKDKLESEPGRLASVPGSQLMWSIGFLVSGSTPEFGEILGYTAAGGSRGIGGGGASPNAASAADMAP